MNERTFTAMDTLYDAREWLRSKLREGAKCPVCTQRAQLYRRKLNSGMAVALIQIYRHAGRHWVRVQNIPDGPRGGDYAKLRFWGLLEEHPSHDGRWRVTMEGELFIHGQLRAPSHIGTFNNQQYKLAPDTYTPITIREALGSKFDLDELMGAGVV